MNARQRRFVAEYLKDGNATQAAIRAGYSKKTAGSQAHDLLKLPEIAKAVGARLERAEIKSEAVLEEIRGIAFADPSKAKPRAVLPRYEHKLKALELLGKHLKLFTEKVEHSFDGLTDEQLEARYRALTAMDAAADAAKEPKE